MPDLSGRVLRSQTSAARPEEPGNDPEVSIDVTDHLESAIRGVEDMRERLHALEKENGSLRRQLSSVQQRRSKRRERNALENKECDALRSQFSRLRREHRKAQKRIRDLELTRDAEELQASDTAVEDDESSDSQMREILRQIQQIMLLRTIAEDEECSICYENLKTNETKSLPCEHVLCERCINNVMLQGRKCPTCRQGFEVADIITVTHTAGQQWDMLLAEVEKWAHLDGGDDESEAPGVDQNSATSDTEESSQTREEPSPENPLLDDIAAEYNFPFDNDTPRRRLKRRDDSPPPPDPPTTPPTTERRRNRPVVQSDDEGDPERSPTQAGKRARFR